MKFNEPMGWPQGTVRAVLTILVVASSIILHAVNLPSPELDGIAAAALGHYFGSRTAKTGAPGLAPSEPVPMADTFAADPNEVEVDKTQLIAGE